MPSFQDQCILITGATSGIGRALTLHLLQQGAYVAVCARKQEALDQLKQEANSTRLLCIQADVSREEDCKRFVENAAREFGAIHILINNAGISMRALFQEAGPAILKQNMDINFWGAVYCTYYALPHIIRQKGSIAGISSVAGYKGLPARSGYSASKFALQGFLESLRLEMIPEGVNVLWICPGFVASNIRNTALNAQGEAQTETPLNEHKLMSADECARHIAQAILKRKRNVLMDFQGKLTVWVNRFFPRLADKLVYKHFLHEPGSPLKPLNS